MAEEFRFQCPECKRPYKANKDLGGRLKRCGKCRGTFTIKRLVPAKKGPPAPEVVVVHDPELPIDQVFNALHEWQKTAPSLPGSFAREITFGTFDPAYRVTLEATVEADGRRTPLRDARETAALPPGLLEAAAPAARKVVELSFDHTSQLADLLADKPAVVRETAERMAKELRPPAGGRFAGRHLVVVHLQVWKAHWSFHRAEGDAWFFGKPLRVHLPDPPKRSAAPAVLATLFALAALGAVGWVLLEYDLIKPGALKPPAPVAATPPAGPKSVEFAHDGVLQLEDGAFLRGALERRDEAVVVRKGGRSTSLAPWQIESTHLDAPDFLRREAKRLDDLEGRVKSARGASRETLVGLFLEIHRQRDRWTPLAALCAGSELPGDPQKRLDVLRAEIEKLLEPPVAAVTPSATPAVVAKPPEPSPAVALAAGLFGQLASTSDRPALAAALLALKAEKLPQAELLEFAGLYLAKDNLEAGLAVDRLRVQTGQFDQTYDGAFEKRSDAFVKLRLPMGPDVTAYREKGAWVAMLPGGVNVSDAQVTVTPGARTASSDRLRAAFETFPPGKWMDAGAAEHLRAAKGAAAPSKDRGGVLLRALAAGHAGTALRTGAPAEILEARGILHGLGYVQSTDGRWERPEDRRAAQMGRLLASGKPEDARALLPGSRVAQDFFGTYRSAALQLQSPLKSVEELNRATAALDLAIGQASTPGESKHLLALKAAVSGFGICGSCGGNPAKLCTACKGKGSRTEACAPCNGQGYIVTVGIGATGNKTCDVCKGKPIRGTRPCEKCDGKGSRSCAKCQGQTRLPAATDLARPRPCASCRGSGSRGDAIQHPCASCAALGVQLVPAGAPDAALP